jgi:hypothetical protein
VTGITVTGEVSSYFSRYLPATALNVSNLELAYPLSGTVFSNNTNDVQRFNYIINNPSNLYKTFKFSTISKDNIETIVAYTSSIVGYIDIPYSTEIFSDSGVKILLKGYNEMFPYSSTSYRRDPRITSPVVIPTNTVEVLNPNISFTSNFEFDTNNNLILPPVNNYFQYNPRIVLPPEQSLSSLLISEFSNISLNDFKINRVNIREILINVTPLSARIPFLHISDTSSSVYNISSSKGNYSTIIYGEYTPQSNHSYTRQGPIVEIGLGESVKPGLVDLYRELDSLGVTMTPRSYIAINNSSNYVGAVTIR